MFQNPIYANRVEQSFKSETHKGLLLQSYFTVRVISSKDERDLQPPAKRLIEKKSSLESGYEGKPREHGYWDEDKHAHPSIVETSKGAHRLPKSHLLDKRFPCNGNLKNQVKYLSY